ncbi:hypothetical protein ADIS_3463 [Lunatimonas lonarensis]|uniref:Uncharacterized protein n=1 Tax=Lunatimonas lonarensis TaxID=1232681 RepID=R7ZQE5_9BACT|nr:hypothetical protein ADIS_3463 [Lunatimonas lonarensis]
MYFYLYFKIKIGVYCYKPSKIWVKSLEEKEDSRIIFRCWRTVVSHSRRSFFISFEN